MIRIYKDAPTKVDLLKAVSKSACSGAISDKAQF